MPYFRHLRNQKLDKLSLTIWDIVLTPLYLLVLIAIARRIRNKNYPVGHHLRKYYLPGLYVKFGGVVFIALVYQFYYGGGGDTFYYYQYGKVVNSSFSQSFDTWLNLLLRASPDTHPYIYPYARQIEFYNDTASYTIVILSALLGLLTYNTYIPAALILASITYSGIWAMYSTFVKAFPNLYKELAFAFLFIPSVFVWGSAIFKDTVCMFSLGWMTYTSFRIFVNRDFSAKNFVLLALSFYLITIIKIYILLAFLPSLMLWLLLTYADKIRSKFLRLLIGIGILGLVIFGFLIISQTFSKQLKRYSLDGLSTTAKETRGWITYASGDDGAAYDLGVFDPSLVGILTKFPAGVGVTLFRPFLWEVKKPIQLLSSLEGLAFLIGTVLVFYRNGFIKTFRLIFSNPNLVFFFTFSMIFAFAVGLSTGNFGALSRYKIPCLPFFAALLVVLYYSRQKVQNRKKPTLPLNDPVWLNTSSYSR